MTFSHSGVFLLGYFLGCVGLNTYRLQDFCKEDGSYDLSMIREKIYAGQLAFTYQSYMAEDFKCTVIVGLPTRLCGRSFDYFSKEFTTSWRHLQVEYHANRPEVGSGFTIDFKHFSDPPCASYEYLCDNGRCIREDLKCKGNNPCGDNSDCKEGISTGSIIGIVVGCCAGLGLVIFLYRYLPTCFKSSDTDRGPQSNSQSYPVSRIYGSGTRDENGDAPPDYTDLQNREQHSDGARNGMSRRDADSQVSHRPQSVTPTAVDHGNRDDNGGETRQYMPPPPSYELVMNYRDLYDVSESQPNAV